MRFVWGPVPESETLDPAAAAWTKLKEWKAGTVAVVATVIGLPFVFGGLVLLGWAFDSLRRPDGSFEEVPEAIAIFVALFGVVAMVPVHEFIHGLAYGQSFASRRMIFGCWLTRGMFYAHYDSPLPRNRVLAMLAAPFLALSVLPIAAFPFLHPFVSYALLAYCAVHASLCGGDLILFVNLLARVPRNALIHNQGWQTYWHVPEADEAAIP